MPPRSVSTWTPDAQWRGNSFVFLLLTTVVLFVLLVRAWR